MAKQTAEIEVKVTGEKQAQSKLGKLGSFIKSKLVITIGDLTRAVKGVIGAIGNLVESGRQFIILEKSFKSLTDSYAINGNELLKELDKVAQGTISKAQLMEASNKALLLTSGTVGDKIPQLLAIARASAKATGQDINFMFDSIITGIGRGSPMILDNLGLTIKLSEGYDAYAKELGKTSAELTKTEQQQALLNQVLSSGNELIAKSGVETEDALDAFSRFNTELADLKSTLGKSIAPALAADLAIINKFLKGILDNTEKAKISQEDLAAISEKQAQKMADSMAKRLTDEQKKLEELEAERAEKSFFQSKKEIDLQIKNQKILIENYQERFNRYSAIETAHAQKRKANAKMQIEQEKQIQQQIIDARVEAGNKQGELIAERLEKEKEAAEARENLVKNNALAELETIDDLNKAILNSIKKRIIGELTAEQAAAIATITIEIAKAIASFNFAKAAAGFGQLAVPVAQTAAAIGAVNSIQFAQGGNYERANVSQTPAGQTAIDNEAGLERVTVEPIGKQDQNQIGQPIQNIIMLDGKVLAKQLNPYLKAVERKVI